MTTRKTIDLIRWTLVGKVMSLLLNMLSVMSNSVPPHGLYSPGNYIQYLVITSDGKESEKVICTYIDIYIYTKLNHFAVYQKLTQNCKSTVFIRKGKSTCCLVLSQIIWHGFFEQDQILRAFWHGPVVLQTFQTGPVSANLKV